MNEALAIGVQLPFTSAEVAIPPHNISDTQHILAHDGYLAYPLHPWTRDKLYYIQHYLGIMGRGMRKHWPRLVYVDLMSGPGICFDPGTGTEENGSSLLAVERLEFDKIFLNDISSAACEALRERTKAQPPDRVIIRNQDCNKVGAVARNLLYPTSRGTLGLTVIDPWGFQIDYETIRKLTEGVRMDLIIIFMTFELPRTAAKLSKNQNEANRLTKFFGTLKWESFAHKPTQLLELYQNQIRKLGYEHIEVISSRTSPGGNRKYHIIYASKHETGKLFFSKIATRDRNGQLRLL